MLSRVLLCTAPLLLGGAAASAPPWDGYLDEGAYVSRLEAIRDEAPGKVRLERYGTSREGRPLFAIVLGEGEVDVRPTFLVTAGIDALHPAGTEYSVRIAERLLADHADLLDEVTIVLMPRANPDGIARLASGPNDGHRGGVRVVDADRDGFVDEDGPRDLDGDGVVAMMRLVDPPLAHPPTHLVDPGESRMMKRPDVAAGERPTHAMFVEGVDADGDGLIAEDGQGEVRIDRNFLHLYVEHDLDSGPYQLSEPEAMAMAGWVLDRPNLVGALVFGPHDWIVSIPDSKKRDITGRTPVGIDGGDRGLQETLASKWKQHTGQVRSEDEEDRGGFHAWLYAHRGVPTVATTGWGRPDPTGDESGEKSGEGEAAPAPSDAEGAAWLAWSDSDRDGGGFVEWRPFEHPQLGPVEIGGPVPGFRINPPIEVIDDLSGGHAAFIADWARSRPRVVVEGPEVEPLGGGLFRIRLALVNEGPLPLRAEMSRINRAIRPMLVRPDVPIERLVQGAAFESVDRLAPGARRDMEWIVRGSDEPMTILVDDPQGSTGDVKVIEVVLDGGAR